MVDCIYCDDEGCEECDVGDVHLMLKGFGGANAYCSRGDADGCMLTDNIDEVTCQECINIKRRRKKWM